MQAVLPEMPKMPLQSEVQVLSELQMLSELTVLSPEPESDLPHTALP